ncbi:MAG: tRNA (adenosine(37)-N6)-threonylcarbamoyltransferase complex transferase subunit TsaD [Candidatus Omnitrophica bacterium]|nr:tRNA (adenosine(37)-N6)-threonylcarbamoyltransferase complex transferase subunit TsaD [Candidatus Omnitrophota bacterium]
MNILGIETSCDETAAAIVKDGRYVLSHVVASSLKEHQKYGGIIPEIASRRQMELIQLVVEEALSKSSLTLSDVDALAVTSSPGLIGSLLVGLSYARALSYATGKPLVEVNHIHAHLYANFLEFLANDKASEKKVGKRPTLPAVGLVVSGGHTSLYYLKNFSSLSLLGQTRDDAAGEAFDKVARILNLGYPGGPVIDRLAQTKRNTRLKFPVSELSNSFDFSFSGVKTAVLYHHRQHHQEKDFSAAEVAAAFQHNVVSALVEKSIQACLAKKVKTLLVGGGVAANSALRQSLVEEGRVKGINVFFPPLTLCLDNAAMSAGLGFHLR